MKNFYDKYITNNIWFKVLSISAILLIIASFVVPPLGLIDNSVIAAVGEIFAFAALYTLGNAIDKGKTASITHGQTTLTVKEEEEEDFDSCSGDEYDETEDKDA